MHIHCLYDDLVDPLSLKEHPKNRNVHPKDQIKRLIQILEYQGFRYAIKVSNQSGFITSGHGRRMAAIQAGIDNVPVVYQDYVDEAQEYADIVADNAIAAWAELDLSSINVDIQDLGPEFDLDLLGIKDFKVDVADKITLANDGSLAEQYICPPVSVFDSRQGYWKDRQLFWNNLGIDSGDGRDDVLGESEDLLSGTKSGYDTIAVNKSIFNPVTAEIAYRWFSPMAGVVLDPFAGGSVRGIVASLCGRNYIGLDLSEKQIIANRLQAERICDHNRQPCWIVADSINIPNICHDVEADLIFSCPPYLDLEVYSDDKNDLSNMTDEKFYETYKSIIKNSLGKLKNNRFAIFVVSEVRDKKTGKFRHFVPKTIEAFQNGGASFYNEIIFINNFGTAALTAKRPFVSSRKVARVHQNILVFCKGNPKIAAEECGHVLLEGSNE